MTFFLEKNNYKVFLRDFSSSFILLSFFKIAKFSSSEISLDFSFFFAPWIVRPSFFRRVYINLMDSIFLLYTFLFQMIYHRFISLNSFPKTLIMSIDVKVSCYFTYTIVFFSGRLLNILVKRLILLRSLIYKLFKFNRG